MKRWFREPISGLTHLGGAVLSVVGLVWLITLTQGEELKLVSVVVYGVSLVFLYSASAAMHLVKASSRVIDYLNRVDHAGIYILTAGTYTPICLNVLVDPLRMWLLTAVWIAAAAGIAHKLVIGPGRKSSMLSTLFYLAMGWMAVVALPQLVRRLPMPALALIAAGGLAYSVGAIVYMFDDPDVRPGFGLHEIWHLFVLTGSGLHFAAVAGYVV